MGRIDREIRRLKDLKWAQDRSPEEHNRIAKLNEELWEYREWQDAIEGEALVKKALKIGLYLDEIVFLPEGDSMYQVGPYRRAGTFGNIILIPEFRRAIEKAVREREPIYKREKRESAEFWLKIVVGISTVLVGLLGAVTGLVAVSHK